MKILQKRFLFVVLVAMMLLPALQSKFNFFKLEPLDGAFELSGKPEFKLFTWKRWFSEEFQKKFNKSIEDNIGFRNLLIRLNNQIDYELFRRTTTFKAVIGKSDCLYEEGYILDYTGRNFVGKDFINKQLQRTKAVQDYLKKEKNIDLIIVFEPGKASYFPEYIPDRYHPENKTLSNYKYYVQECKALHINFLDLNAWFTAVKDTTKYSLYPMYGIHWSTYGMNLAFDTIERFIEKTRRIDMRNFYWNTMRVTDTIKDVDYDIELTLNLLFKLPHEALAYPIIKFEKDSGKVKPKVLTIADSYYWSIYNSKMPDSVFGKHEFWYYNYTIYPDSLGQYVRYVNHEKDKENFEKQEIILLMITELNLYRGFMQFIDMAYKIYFPDAATDEVYEFKRNYVNSDYSLKNLLFKADSCKITAEKMLDNIALKAVYGNKK